jgi:lysophospholipid acyltransferase (LPLAT)-like uncharacterized protein
MTPMRARLVAGLYYLGLTALYKSVRLQVMGQEELEALWARGGKAIVCFFHGDYLLFFPHFRGRQVTIFTSRSHRGAYLAEIIALFGNRPCLLPDQRKDPKTLEWMVAELEQGHSAGLAVDGPLGPYRVVKPGALVLAQRTGHPIVPVGIASAWHITLKKRWDRYALPLPFTRAAICIGEPIAVPRDAHGERLEPFRETVEKALLRLNDQARAALNRQRAGPAV